MTSDFNLCLNHFKIEQSDSVKYLSVHLNSKLSWKTHIEKLNLQIIKSVRNDLQRHFVHLSTLKLCYYAMLSQNQQQYKRPEKLRRPYLRETSNQPCIMN